MKTAAKFVLFATVELFLAVGILGQTVPGLGVARNSALIPAANGSAQTFSNFGGLLLVDEGPASVYPSTILVSGMTGVLTQLAVTLHGVSHSFADDMDILLVGPGGQGSIVMSDAGGGFEIDGVDLSFQAGAGLLPNSLEIVSGTYGPSNWGLSSGDPFAPPAPAGLHPADFSVFRGTSPNGTWSLFVIDDVPFNDGAIDGWSLTLWTEPLALSIALEDSVARIAWPKVSGYVLEARPIPFNSADAWSSVTNEVILLGGSNVVFQAVTEPGQMFRLRQQAQ